LRVGLGAAAWHGLLPFRSSRRVRRDSASPWSTGISPVSRLPYAQSLNTC
jgi:hypothetical protein